MQPEDTAVAATTAGKLMQELDKSKLWSKRAKFEGNFRKKLLKRRLKREDMVSNVWDSHSSDRTCGGGTGGLMNRRDKRTRCPAHERSIAAMRTERTRGVSQLVRENSLLTCRIRMGDAGSHHRSDG